MLNDFSITFYGGFAILSLLSFLLFLFLLGMFIYTLITGNKTEITFESKGIVNQIKKLHKKDKKR